MALRRQPDPGPPDLDGSSIDLVLAARTGDQFAFHVLYRRTVRAVTAYLAPLARDDRERRRLTQRTYARAWRELPALDRPHAFTLWLLRLAHDEAAAAAGDDLTPYAGRGISRASAVDAVYGLPARLREIVTLRFLFDEPREAVARGLAEHIDAIAYWERQALEELALTSGVD